METIVVCLYGAYIRGLDASSPLLIYSSDFSSYFLLSVILFVCQKGGDDMQKENNLTVGQWCDQWFTTHHYKWNGNTEGGYRNLIYSHILPGVGSIELSGLTEQTVTGFYDDLQSKRLSARSVWCVHLLLRRCMDEAAQTQLIPYNPVRFCQEPKAEEYKTATLRLG